jgi:membrane protease YdiL (CAAX protease family)
VGEIVSTYFDFLKQNVKSFTNVFIAYNGLFIFLLLGASYLLVTGFIGMINVESGFGNSNQDEAAIYIGFGAIIFIGVFIIIAALNYSLASAYMIQYDQKKQIVEDRTNVWAVVKDNSSRIIIFMLLLMVIYIGYYIVNIIVSFIPILGFFGSLILSFGITSWLGVSFMVMFHERKSPSEALGIGWDLVKSNFWKCVGSNFILGMLVGILLLLLLTIPGVIIGFYTFHVVESGFNVADSIVAKIIYTFGLCALLIVSAYSQSLSQFVNGILFFSLHEEKYNTHTREKINQIGASE